MRKLSRTNYKTRLGADMKKRTIRKKRIERIVATALTLALVFNDSVINVSSFLSSVNLFADTSNIEVIDENGSDILENEDINGTVEENQEESSNTEDDNKNSSEEETAGSDTENDNKNSGEEESNNDNTADNSLPFEEPSTGIYVNPNTSANMAAENDSLYLPMAISDSEISDIPLLRSGQLTREKVTINGKSYYTFSITRADDLLALQQVSANDSLEDCAFTFTDSGQGSQWDLSAIAGFTGISPNEEYPFKGIIGANISRGVNYTLGCPLFEYISTDATVQNISLLGKTGNNSVAAIGNYLVRGNAENITIRNVTIRGTFLNTSTDKSAGALFANVINENANRPIILNTDDWTNLTFALNGTSKVIVNSRKDAGGLVGYAKGNVTIKIGNNINFDNFQIVGNGSYASSGTVVGCIEDGAVLQISSQKTYSILSGIQGLYAGGLVGLCNNAKILVDNNASVKLVTTTSYSIGNGQAKYAGGIVGYCKDSEISIKNVSANVLYLSSYTSSSTKGNSGGIIGRMENCHNSEIRNISLESVNSSDIKIYGYICGGIVGDVSGNDILFKDIEVKGYAYYGYSNYSDASNAIIAARASGTNIIFDTCKIEICYSSYLRGYTRGGVIGSVYNTDDNYNSIKIKNITATGRNGATGGGLSDPSGYTQGSIIGAVSSNSLVCFDGTIDVSKITYMGSSSSSSYRNLRYGILVGYQNGALIYREPDAKIIKADENSISGTKNDIGSYGGVYVNRYTNSNKTEKLISFETDQTKIKDCVKGMVSKGTDGSYVLTDVNDFFRLSIALATEGKFASGCFNNESTSVLLSSNYRITASTIDLRNTGIYSLTKTGTSTSSATVANSFSGSFTGINNKTKIILENVISTQYNLGLFSSVADATFKNLEITSGSDANDFGYRHARNFGAIAAIAFNDITIENVSTGTSVYAWSLDRNEELYYGGAIGYINLQNGKIKVSDYVAGSTVTNLTRVCVAGGLAGYVLSSTTSKTDASPIDISLKNMTVAFKAYTNSSYYSADSVTDIAGRIAGVIAVLNNSSTAETNATYTKVAMQNIVVDGTIIDMSNCSGSNTRALSSAGFIGNQWNNVEAVISRNAVDTTNTTNNSLFVKSGTINAQGYIGACINTYSGKLTLKDIVLGGTGGIKINNGTVRANGGLFGYNYVNAYVVIDGYTVNPTNITYTGSSYGIDDIVGCNLNFYTDHYGHDGGIVNIKDANFAAGTSQGYVNKLYPNATQGSTYTRYYYNVLENSPNYTEGMLDNVIDTPEKLMVYHLYQYSDSTIKRFVSPYITGGTVKTTNTITGTIDLKGHSYYPTLLPGNGAVTFTGNNAVIKFPEDETINLFTNNNITTSTSRHYRMYGGLFVNAINSATTVSVSGITFMGAIGRMTENAFLFHATLYGTHNISDITFDGAHIYRYGDSNLHNLGLMISYVTENANVRITGVTTKGYSDTQKTQKVASALIGVVGNSTARNIKVVFRDIDVDFMVNNSSSNNVDNTISPFKYATLICTYDHINDSGLNNGYGVYYFTSDDYNNGRVTLGKELKNGVEFEDDLDTAVNALAYARLNSDVASIAAAPNAYLPYVCDNNTITIFVNPKSGNLTKGCGTYEDPYIIENSRQLYSLYMYLSGNTSYDAILHSWTVNELGNQSAGGPVCDKTTHTAHIYEDRNSEAGFPSRQELAGAYYLVTKDIDMTNGSDINELTLGYEYTGLGNSTYPFTGVIVGRLDTDGSEPTIILAGSHGSRIKTNYGFIQYMKGGVVKDIILKTDTYENENGNRCYVSEYSGFVASAIIGGDNIIDNVTLKGTLYIDSNSTYVAGYVGRIIKGGLVLRDVDKDNLKDFDVNLGNVGSIVTTRYNYISSIVEDGYILFESVNNTPVSTNKKIIVKEDLGLDTYDLSYMFEPVNVDYLNTDTSKIGLSVNEGTKQITVNLNSDKDLEVIALALNSDSLSFCGLVRQSTNGYDSSSVNRKAYYNNLGTNNASNADLVLARTYDNGHYEYPYLLYKYFQPATSFDDYYENFTVSGENYKISKLNRTSRIENIAGLSEYSTVYVVAANSTLDMTGYEFSFRGIGALYNKTYSRFNGSFNGNNSKIIVDMSVDYDTDTIYELGLFNELDTTAFVAALTERDIVDTTAPFIRNIIVQGKLTNNSVLTDTTNNNYRNNARTGGIAASILGSYIFENIKLQGLEVTAYGDAGGIVGRVLNTGSGKWYSINISNCSIGKNPATGEKSKITSNGVTSHTNVNYDAGGFIGKIGVPSVVNDIRRSQAAFLYQGTVKITDANADGAIIYASQGGAGGLIGYAGYLNMTTIDVTGTTLNNSVSSSLLNDITLELTNNTRNYNGSAGGVIGQYDPIRYDQNSYSTAKDTLNIENVEIRNSNINAHDMTSSSYTYYMYGYYGLGGLIGSANARYGSSNVATTVTVDNCRVKDVNITDTTTATNMGTAGGIAGALGGQNSYSYIDFVDIKNSVVDGLETATVKNWAVGGLVGHINGTNSSSCPIKICDNTVKNSLLDATTAAVGGGLGVLGVNTYNTLIKNIVIDSCELNTTTTTASSDDYSTYVGTTGGLIGTATSASGSNINIYNIENKNSKLSGYFTGGIIGNTRTSSQKFTINKLKVDNSVIAGVMAGGIFGRQSNTGSSYSNFINDVTVSNNKIFGYGNYNYTGIAGGLIGRGNYSYGSSGLMYISNVAVSNNVIAVTALDKCKAGGLYGSVDLGNVRVYKSVMTDNRLGFLEHITGYDKSIYDIIDTINYETEVKLRNTLTATFEIQQEQLANQNDILKYSYGIGNYIGQVVNSSATVWLISPKVNYSNSYKGAKPATDVGIYNVFTNPNTLSRPNMSEPYAITRFTVPTDIKQAVHILYTENINGIDTLPVEYAKGPSTLDVFNDANMVFSNIGTILSKYDEILEKESDNTLTFSDVINNYRLNIAYDSVVNPEYSTVKQIMDISYLTLEDAAPNFEGAKLPIIVADGQYATAYDVVNAVIDTMTNGGGTFYKGTTDSIYKIEANKAKITKDASGKYVLEYQSGTPSIKVTSTANMEYNGFDTFGTDSNGKEYATITVLKVTYGWSANGSNYTYTAQPDTEDGNTKFTVTTDRIIYIPVFVKERLEVDISFQVKEGAVLNAADISSTGYTGSVVMAKDTTYSILSHFKYGASVENPNYKDLSVEKTLRLDSVNGDVKFDVGTKLTLIDVNTGHVYYYEITEENANLSSIPYTSFVDENGVAYENKKMQWFNDNNFVKTDEEGNAYADDDAIIIVDLPKEVEAENAVYTISISTEGTRNSSQMQISNENTVEVTSIPGLVINFDNKVYSNEDSDSEERTYISGELTNTKKDAIIIDARTAIAAAKDPESGIASYWDYVTGTDNVIDSSNNGKYLEIAIYLQEQNGAQRMALPVGTIVKIYDDEFRDGREIELSYGQSVIYYYKDSNREYALDDISRDTYKQHKIVLDFSNTDLKDYTNANYEIYMELIRTENSKYPMSSDRQDDYLKPVATASTKELAIAMEVIDLITLGINTYRQAVSEYEIPFISKIDFSDVIDFENSTEQNINELSKTYSDKNYYIAYRIYKKVYDNNNELTYERVDDTFIKLYYKNGDDYIEYPNNGRSGGNFKYERTIKLTADEIRNGTDGIEGLITKDMKIVVNTVLNGMEADLTNYKIEMRLIPYDDGIINISDETAYLRDFFIFTIAELKTDM